MSDTDELAEVTTQQHKLILNNGESICRLMSVNRVLLSNSVNNDITVCLFKRTIVVEIYQTLAFTGEWSVPNSD